MLRRTIELGRFLRALAGTEPLREYCRLRGIPFEPGPDGEDASEAERWQAAVASLPPERRADIELEITQVQELGNRDAIGHLIDVCAGRNLPTDLVPGEAAQALWFLVHEPAIFREVYFHEEVLDGESWRHATAPPGIAVGDHASRRPAFEAELRRFYRAADGTGRFCASQSVRFADPDCIVFVGYVADRLRLLDVFDEGGARRHERIRPASPVLFAYYPGDGTVLLKCRQRARDKVLGLLRAFARSVLRAEVDERSLDARFLLDRLKEPFDPPLPEGVAAVRVRSLDLAYPPHEGRRRLRLETGAADRPSAIPELLRRHVDEESRARLQVVAAELQVTLRVRGRPKHHVIRLWPDRCTLGRTGTAEFLRSCLNAWGLIAHAPEP